MTERTRRRRAHEIFKERILRRPRAELKNASFLPCTLPPRRFYHTVDLREVRPPNHEINDA